MYSELVNKKNTMAVIGLGYVGLPIALEFAKKIRVIGFDIKEDRTSFVSLAITKANYVPQFEPIWMKRLEGGILEKTIMIDKKDNRDRDLERIVAKVKELALHIM